MKKTTIRNIVLAALMVGVLIAILRTLPIASLLEDFNRWVASLGAWGIVLFVLVYVVATVLFLPGSVLTLGAGFSFGLLWGMVAVSLGSTLGAAAAFAVSRYVARDKVLARLGGAERVAAVDRAVSKEGWKIVALLRLSPVFPFVALNYLLGLTGVRFREYVLASWAGMLPGTLLYVYLGYAGKAGLETAASGGAGGLKLLYTGLGLLATFAVTIYITTLARKAMKEATSLETSV